LDAVQGDAAELRKGLPKEDELRLDEHLSSIRDLERSIASLAPEYRQVAKPDEDFDMKDWPRIAKLQSDLLAHALVTGQTRVASYMLTKCQGLSRFPWLGYTAARHHDYTHADGKAPGFDGPGGQRASRSYIKGNVQFGLELEWRPGRGPFSVTLGGLAAPNFSSLPGIYYEELAAHYRFLDTKAVDATATLGVALEQMEYKDDQQVSNHIHADFGPMLVAGVELRF
jgi:hypothetical protein